MKIKPWEVDSFVRRLDPEVPATLCFGRDEGLIREHALTLGGQVVTDLSDPFRVIDLAPAALTDDPARLADEAGALSMTGGRRLIRVERAGDAIAAVIGAYLAGPAGDCLVMVTAGDLGARSRLRKLFEADKRAVALPCYPDQARQLDGLVREVLGRHGLTAEPAALDYLLAHLGGDRMVSRGELEKLALYMSGADDAGGLTVTLADAMACVGDSAALGLDRVCDAALTGDLAAMERGLARSFAAGQSPISVLRVLAMRLQRLQRLVGWMGRGLSADGASKKLRPPAFSREARQLSALSRRWSADKLARALEIIGEAEVACKTTGLPAQAVCARAVMMLTAAARRPAGG